MTEAQLDRAIGIAMIIASLFHPDLFKSFLLVVAGSVFYFSGVMRK